MQIVFGFLLRWLVATLIVGLVLQALFTTSPSLRWLPTFILGNLFIVAGLAFPLGFLRWSWLLMTGAVIGAGVVGAPVLGVPTWTAAIGGALMALVGMVAWRQKERRAPAVRVRDQQGRHVELSVIRREGGHLLQLVSAESRPALATAAPSVLPIGALKLTETAVLDDKLVVFPGYINTQTGYFSQGGSYTKKVDTGRRLVRIADEGGVVLPPDHLLDPDTRRVAPAARATQRPTSIGFVVSKRESARLKRWWAGHRRELALGGKDAAERALKARMASEVAAAKKAARIDGVAEYRVDEQGRVTHYLELNRRGDAYARVKGEETRVPGPAGADLVLALLDPRSAPPGTPAWDGGVALGAGSELVKMARYVQQTR